MKQKKQLDKIGLTLENCIVIGSGILSALNIRQSLDVDVVVKEEKYKELVENQRFRKSETHGREILADGIDGIFEIGTNWEVLGKNYKFEDLLPHSTIIENMRYNTLEFLLSVKKYCVKQDANPRQKDIDDIKLIENYLTV